MSGAWNEATGTSCRRSRLGGGKVCTCWGMNARPALPTGQTGRAAQRQPSEWHEPGWPHTPATLIGMRYRKAFQP